MREQARLARQDYSDAVLDVLMVGRGCAWADRAAPTHTHMPAEQRVHIRRLALGTVRLLTVLWATHLVH